MRRSCCYAPDILEMLQAELVTLFFNLLLDMPVVFFVQMCSFFCEQNGEEPTHTRTVTELFTYEVLRSAEITAASRSCHTRVKFSLEWSPGDSALTVRRRDCYRRSSAGSDRIDRPRT